MRKDHRVKAAAITVTTKVVLAATAMGLTTNLCEVRMKTVAIHNTLPAQVLVVVTEEVEDTKAVVDADEGEALIVVKALTLITSKKKILRRIQLKIPFLAHRIGCLRLQMNLSVPATSLRCRLVANPQKLIKKSYPLK